MKKLSTMLMVFLMIFTLVGCGGASDKNDDNDEQKVIQNEEIKSEETEKEYNETVDVQGVDLPIDEYPFLDSLVLPDDGVVSSIDDEWYKEDGIIDIYVKPIIKAEQVNAYKQKLASAGYKEAEVSGLTSPDFKLELLIGDMWVESEGYLIITVYDTNSDGGNALTSLANLEIEGIEIPEEVAKYVGTLDSIYEEDENTIRASLRNADDDAFERLFSYYALSGTLDEEQSTRTEKIYIYEWGYVCATHFGVDEEIAIEIKKE